MDFFYAFASDPRTCFGMGMPGDGVGEVKGGTDSTGIGSGHKNKNPRNEGAEVRLHE